MLFDPVFGIHQQAFRNNIPPGDIHLFAKVISFCFIYAFQ